MLSSAQSNRIRLPFKIYARQWTCVLYFGSKACPCCDTQPDKQFPSLTYWLNGFASLPMRYHVTKVFRSVLHWELAIMIWSIFSAITSDTEILVVSVQRHRRNLIRKHTHCLSWFIKHSLPDSQSPNVNDWSHTVIDLSKPSLTWQTYVQHQSRM